MEPESFACDVARTVTRMWEKPRAVWTRALAEKTGRERDMLRAALVQTIRERVELLNYTAREVDKYFDTWGARITDPERVPIDHWIELACALRDSEHALDDTRAAMETAVKHPTPNKQPE